MYMKSERELGHIEIRGENGKGQRASSIVSINFELKILTPGEVVE